MTPQEQALRGYLEHAWMAGLHHEGIRSRPKEIRESMNRYLDNIDYESALNHVQRGTKHNQIVYRDAKRYPIQMKTAVGPCGCACCHGGFCGGCGHAGCGHR